jgi:hypothetical protein
MIVSEELATGWLNSQDRPRGAEEGKKNFYQIAGAIYGIGVAN